MPSAGRDYPTSYGELRAWFNEDWKCLDYLDWLRWPDGFVCPGCGSDDGWRAADGRWRCAGCDRRVSATAGTIFHGTRTPLTVWLSAAWHLTSGKVGISATQLRREMELGSYQTAWAMLHRYRPVMVRPGRDRLPGEVEVDESFLGGPEAGTPGRGALGKVLFAAAVELDIPWVRPCPSGDHQGRQRPEPAAFLKDNVEPGAPDHRRMGRLPESHPRALQHKPPTCPPAGERAHEVLPAVHTVLSLVKRWVAGTLQGSVSPEHLPAYLDEWVFRFNRRRSRSRGLLFYRLMSQAVTAEPSPTGTCAKRAGSARRHHHHRRPRLGRSRGVSSVARSGCLGAPNERQSFHGT